MYTLRFPFELPANHTISNPTWEYRFGHLNVSLTHENNLYVLTLNGFESEESATAFVPQVWAGLMSLLVNRGIAPKANLDLGKVSYSKNPKEETQNVRERLGLDRGNEVHGYMDGNWPAVYATNKTIIKVTAGKISCLLSYPGSEVRNYIKEGLELQNPQALMEDQKLQTALELYSAFYTEHSERAKFITLVMVLEALSEGEPRTPFVQKFLKGFLDEVNRKQATLNPESVEAAELADLKQEIFFRKENSKRNRIRKLALNTLAEEPDVHEIARQAVKVYDMRSTLVHDGFLPPKELVWSSPDFADTFEKAHNEPGGVSWRNGGSSVQSLNRKPFTWSVKVEGLSPRWPKIWESTLGCWGDGAESNARMARKLFAAKVRRGTKNWCASSASLLG